MSSLKDCDNCGDPLDEHPTLRADANGFVFVCKKWNRKALRCIECEDGADHFDHALREAVSREIKRYPNTDAEWWAGPEGVLRAVEEYLEIDSEENDEELNENDFDWVIGFDTGPEWIPTPRVAEKREDIKVGQTIVRKIGGRWRNPPEVVGEDLIGQPNIWTDVEQVIILQDPVEPNVVFDFPSADDLWQTIRDDLPESFWKVAVWLPDGNWTSGSLDVANRQHIGMSIIEKTYAEISKKKD